MIESAAAQGLSAICPTTHIDLNPKRTALDRFIRVGGKLQYLHDDLIERYIAEIRGAAANYGCMRILLGFEFSYGRHFEELVKDFIDKFKPDFYLGAIHCLENIGITSKSEAAGYYRAATPERAVEDYFRAMSELVESGLFKTVAHFDGIKKYGYPFYGNSLTKLFEAKSEPVFAQMTSLDVGIEINTSALRRGFTEPYPSKRLLEMAKSCGVSVNSVGSDAHSAEEVGRDLETAYRLIDECGISVGKPLSDFL